jgi:hypothetical protein
MLLALLCAALLFAIELAGAFVWRFLPLSKGMSSITFTILSAALLTPVPVGVGVGAMVYPIFVLYTDVAQLKWYLRWYADEPIFVATSLLITCAFAYVASYKLLPNRTRSKR